MKNLKKIDLEKFKEAIKQADANIKFEEINVALQKKDTQDNTKILKRGVNYDKRTLG